MYHIVPIGPYLIRRGARFYFRARLPSTMRGGVGASHVTISLRTNDSATARRLSLACADRMELLRMPFVSTLTRQQVTAIFQNEVARQLHQLDDLASRVRRLDDFDPNQQAHFDRIMGWVWRLLALFGRHRVLRFDDACPARRMLVAADLADCDIRWIGENVQHEQQMHRRPSAIDAIDDRIRAVQAEPDEMNRRRAFDELFRARAAAFNATDRRYGEQRPEEADLLHGAVMPDFRAADALPLPSAAPANEAATIRLPTEKAHQAIVPALLAADKHEADPIANVLNLAADALLVVEKVSLRQIKSQVWTTKTAAQVRQTAKLFLGLLASFGVETSAGIAQAHIAAFRDLVDVLPPRYGQSAHMRALPVPELRCLGEAMRAKGETVGLSDKTIIRHFGALQSFLTSVAAEGYVLQPLALDKLRPRKPQDDARTESPKPEPKEIEALFRTPVFVGAKRFDRLNVPGPERFHRGAYFASIILAYSGARRHEVCGLLVEDVVTIEDIPAFHIRKQTLRRIKNRASQRLLPIPPEALRLGFMQYVEAIRALGYSMVFPDLYKAAGNNDPGDRLYDELQSTRKALPKDELLWARLLHALRHGWSNTTKQEGARAEVRADVLGHAAKGETEKRYASAAKLRLMLEAYQKVDCFTAHLEPFPLRLLPWVVQKEFPHWERNGGQTRRRLLAEEPVTGSI
ncbi:DUF6538 domain-containing protein [Aureimonas leprariae]|uniref:DUF6538 domain-containing protein n=1 Tax=Plantimonas leprariae TaxID=2615207 RepID=A0A7V7PKX1_9HYPH|nr:DUF6538 domain-containing protein [Aureimonas leprariae]KAB0676437.1 hypothetical protein F6X38_21320 [Aureimonas leprariae]